MAESFAIPQQSSIGLPRRFVQLIPGVVLLFVLGYLGKLAEQLVKNASSGNVNIEYVLWAIIFGMIVANTVSVPKVFTPGVATYEFWLKLGIVLLGARFTLDQIIRIGGISLVIILIELAVAIGIMTGLGHILNLKPKLTSLLAIGSAICGVSAIIAGKGAIEADDEDASFAIAAILTIGAVGVFLFPAIGRALGMSDKVFGLWAGLAVDNTAESIAAGRLFSPNAMDVATLAKNVRNAMIGFVVLGYAVYWASRGQAKQIENKAAFLWQKFPKFVLGFLLMSLLGTLLIASTGGSELVKGALNPVNPTVKTWMGNIGNLSKWAFLLTFAGVGLRTNIREMRKQGWRPFVAGALAELSVAVVTLLLVLAANAVFTL
jgi:uncharacterized integral membrane protein (TIGR00698 family)